MKLLLGFLKPYLYLLAVAAVVWLVLWVRSDAVEDLKASLVAAESAHKIETEKLKRAHDDTKRRLEGETRKRLDELAKITVDGCYGVDTPLPDRLNKLRPPRSDKTRP